MRFWLLISLSLLSIRMNCQSLTWSTPQKVVDRALLTEVVGQNEYGIFVIKKGYREDEHSITIEQYSTDLRRLASKTFFTRRGEYYAQAVLHPRGIYLFFAGENKEARNTDVKVRRLDFSLNQQGSDSTLFSIPHNEFAEKYLQVYKEKLSSRILFLYTSQTTEVPTALDYMQLDSILAIKNTGTYTIDIPDKYEIEQASYTDDRVAMVVHENVKKKQSKNGYQYYILDGAFADQILTKTPLFNDSMEVTEGLLKADIRNRSIVFAGLFSRRDSAYSKGYFIWKRDLKTNRLLKSSRIFPQKAIDEMAGKTARVQGIFNLRTGDITLRKDGGIILTTEGYQETRETLMDMNMYGMSQNNFRYYYYYESMLLLSLNPEGIADWSTVIKKEQVSVNDNGVYSSYILTVLPDRLAFIYNDLSRNNWSLNMVEVDETGATHNQVLIRSQDYDGRLIPQYGDQLSYNSVLIPGINRKGQVFLQVQFDFPTSRK